MDGSSFGTGFTDPDAQRSGALLDYLDAVAAVPAVAAAKREATDALQLRPGDAVLEVGCGTGVDLRQLLDAVGDDGRVVALDPSAAALDVVRTRFAGVPQLQTVEGVVEALPVEPGAFDAVRADRTLQHATDPERALEEIARVLRPGGRLTVLELGARLSGDGLEAATTVARRLFDQGDQAWLPLMLPLLLARSGFESVASRSDATTTDREADALAVLRIDGALADAVADGSMPDAEARAVRSAIGDAARDGTLRLELSVVRFDARRAQPSPTRGAP